MKCPACQFENREGRRFCAECGVSLSSPCAACGFVNAPGEKFCGGCGVSLIATELPAPDTPVAPAETSLPAGERRQVTIMFADISGYTRMTELLDAEDLHETVGRVLKAIDRAVESYGGTVHRHIGDEVMALFGAPIAHSDDPYRSVLAAFEAHKALADLSTELGRALAIHVGIASGTVVIAAQGAPESGDNVTLEVTGIAANLGSRLNAVAKANETIISDEVYRAIETRVTCEPLGHIQVKGIENAVPAWRAIGLRIGAPRQAGGRFVGRRTEIAQFKGVLAASRDNHVGQSILIRGEPGIGKTRLVEELKSVSEKYGFAFHGGQVLDFGVGRGEGAIGGLVSGLLGIPVGGDPAVQKQTLTLVSADGLVEPDQQPFVYDFLNLPQPAELQALYDAMDNNIRAEGRSAFIVSLLKKACARQPQFLAVEDIHWADTETLTYLARLTEAAQHCQAVLIMTTRPEGDPLDQAWRAAAGRPPLMTIDLGPLRESEALELASAFTDVAEAFARNCVARAEGSPLFLEQLLRSAEGSLNRELPGTIQSVVMARMDQLKDEDKAALQAASVLGQRFSLGALRALLNDPRYSCVGLIKTYLVRPEDEDFRFAHALICDGVYGTLLRGQRRALHARAAAWFTGRDTMLRAEHLERADDSRAPAAYFEAARGQMAEYHYERAADTLARGIAIAKDREDLYRFTCLKGEILRNLGSIPEFDFGVPQCTHIRRSNGREMSRTHRACGRHAYH